MKNRILLVDDSITIHRVIDLSLETERFDVEKAFTYEDAINKIKKFNPEVVLLDNKLEGVDVTNFIKELKNNFGAKVILLVGAFDNFDESKLEQYGSDDFLIKPFSSQSLEDKLSKILPEIEGESIVVPLSDEKDMAVEELMSKITQDVNLEDLKKDTIETDFLEEADLKIDLEDVVLDESSSDVKAVSDEADKIEISEFEAKEESKETLDDIFSGLEEIDTSAILENEEKLSKDELLKVEDIEKEIESVKVDKVDLLEDLLSEAETKSSADTFEDLPSLESLEKVSDEKLSDNIDNLEDLKLEETLDIKLPETIVEDEKVKETTETLNIKMVESLEEPKITEDLKEVTSEKTVELQTDTVGQKAIEAIDEERLRNIIAEIVNEDFIKSVIKDVLTKNLEKAVWELIPELAEKLIIAEIEKIKSMDK